MAWRRIGDKPLCKPILTQCVLNRWRHKTACLAYTPTYTFQNMWNKMGRLIPIMMSLQKLETDQNIYVRSGYVACYTANVQTWIYQIITNLLQVHVSKNLGICSSWTCREYFIQRFIRNRSYKRPKHTVYPFHPISHRVRSTLPNYIFC